MNQLVELTLDPDTRARVAANLAFDVQGADGGWARHTVPITAMEGVKLTQPFEATIDVCVEM